MFQVLAVASIPEADIGAAEPNNGRLRFALQDPAMIAEYQAAYDATSALYYNAQPPFEDLIARVQDNAARL